MPKNIFLDTFPTSCTGKAKQDLASETEQCKEWIRECIKAGNKIYVPEISYYEAVRELKRLIATTQIEKLRFFCSSLPDRFIPINSSHIEKSSDLWAISRQNGKQTSSDDSLDGDMILCAQVLSFNLDISDFIVATTNTKHLIDFVPVGLWRSITPGS
jgi:predicted nucleic acid-binding protein